MNRAAPLLRQARRSRKLSQRALAQRAASHQPAIAAIETGKHDASVATLDRLVSATGQRLAVLPTPSRTVAEAAEAIWDCLRHHDERRAFREFVQLSDDLQRESGAIRVALTVTPPAPVGDRRYDALIAALVEHLLADRLPVPTWTSEPARTLHEPWYVEDLPEARERTREETPASFARHRVFLSATELASV